MDAGMTGTTVGPEDAYRFARGEEVVSSTGQPVKLSRPLDFLVVADHSDNMGLAPDFFAGKPEILADPTARRWYDMIKAGKVSEAFSELVVAFSTGGLPKTMQYLPGTPAYRSTWQRIIKAAEAANDPGRFTAIIGYEWTSLVKGNNLHRNAIYRDGGDVARQVEPYTTAKPLGSPDPRDLWTWMANYEAKTGGDVLAIPHNGNVSNGQMFPILMARCFRSSSRPPARKSIAITPKRAAAGNHYTKPRRPKVIARRTQFSRPMTSLPISRPGIRATFP